MNNKKQLIRIRDYDWYKILISIVFGLMGFVGTFYSISFDFSNLKINVIWSFVFPLLVCLAWGWKYGLISMVFGLMCFHPFFLWPKNGWACIVVSIDMILWVLIQGYGQERQLKDKSFYYNVYFLQGVYSLVLIFDYTIIFSKMLKLNTFYWYTSTISHIDTRLLVIIIIKGIVSEFIIIAICDVMLTIPIIKKLFKMNTSKASRYNSTILLLIMLLGTFLWISSVVLYRYLVEKDYTFRWIYSPFIGDVVFLCFLMVSCIIIGGIAIRFFERHLEAEGALKNSENKYRLVLEKMLNGFFVIEPITNREKNFIDIKIVDLNPSFKTQTNVQMDNINGKTWEEIFGYKNTNLNIYQEVFNTGRTIRFETHSSYSNSFYSVNAFKINQDQLGVVFDNITEQKLAMKEVQNLNEELDYRVCERTKELQEVVNELEAFTYTVSHDLKSPIRAIDGYSRIIYEDFGEKLEGDVIEILFNIRNISEGMINMINNLLMYSRTSRMNISKEEVNTKELFNSIFIELMAACPERNIDLIIETELPMVMADKVLLKEAVTNILSNSLKFSRDREKGVIIVGTTKNELEYVFYIKDNGVGFDMEYSGKLFSLFQRLHTIDEFEGSGIGLVTIKKIVNKHGGRAWIEGYLDIGATLYFTLPF